MSAAGLTEPQRRRLLAMKPHELNYAGWGEGSSYASLVRAGLAYKSYPTQGWAGYRLTPLGLSARAALARARGES